MLSISITKQFCFAISFLLLCSCAKKDSSSSPTEPKKDPADTLLVIRHDYIELDKIERISRFRSGVGHDYSDGFEQCRSMKHYFQPKSSTDWGAVKIFSPVSGTVSRVFVEWAGMQLQIRTSGTREYTIILFHISASRAFAVGDMVQAGEQIGTHIGPQTMSDIAVGYSDANVWRLVSYFDLLSDSLFARYVQRGAASRSAFIISREARDGDPLNCSGETFGSGGTIPNWVDLN